MQVTVERDDTIKIVVFEGRLDVAGSEFFCNEILPLIDEKPMIISMAKCPYIASSGLRALLIIAKTAKKKGTNIIYAAAVKHVTDVLEMTGFIKFLHCVSTIEDAIKEIEQK